MATAAFLISVFLMAAHEADAHARHEWRMLPGLRALPDELGARVFGWAHLPLSALAVWMVVSGPFSTVGLAFSGFAVIHAGLHWACRGHLANEFRGPLSWGLILGSGLAGLWVIAAWAGAAA